MAECQKINPEVAAHNVAMAFCKQYVENISSSNKRIFDLDGSEISTCSKYAAELYAISYDEAFAYFSKANTED